MPDGSHIAAKGKEIPMEIWGPLMQILNPMAKKGYKTLYDGIYADDGRVNLYPNQEFGSQMPVIEDPTAYREFPSEEYDYMTNPKNRNIVPYMVPEKDVGYGHIVGHYKGGKENRNKWGVLQSLDPDTLMVSASDKHDKIGTILHELMHVDNPSTRSIEHISKDGRMSDDRNQLRFETEVNELFKEKQASGSIKDILELQELDALRELLENFAK